MNGCDAGSNDGKTHTLRRRYFVYLQLILNWRGLTPAY